jgi:hypothetical protein
MHAPSLKPYFFGRLVDLSGAAAFFKFLRKSLRLGIGISSPCGVTWVFGFSGINHLILFMRQCIFCGGKKNINREHLWPSWLLEKIKPTKVGGFIGHHKDLSFHAEWEVRTVCKDCNGGWMSAMETAVAPIIGPPVDDKSKFIDSPQQWTIAAWAVKTAMMLDSATARASTSSMFYTQEERDFLRVSFGIPPRTTVTLARFLGSRDIGASNSDIWVRGDVGAFPARITTFLLNCVVIQVATIHPIAVYGNRSIVIGTTQGPWDHLMVPCWPTNGRTIYWPPALALDFSDTALSYYRFADRFNLGREVPITPKAGLG